MKTTFRDHIDELILIYLDDILVFSDSKEEHLKHFRTVLSQLRENESYTGDSKCRLAREETEFLSLIVGRNGIKIEEEKKPLFKDWPILKTIADIRTLLGLAHFFAASFNATLALELLWPI